jgi:Fe-S-cluster containining protein
MLIIEDKLVDLDILGEEFACNLSACKGACCWEGEYGATLAPGEKEILEEIREDIKPYMTKEGIAYMDEKGVSTYYHEPKFEGTPVLENGACIYLNYTEEGIGLCGIEQAYRDGKVDFPKPISCHLYPIRVRNDYTTGFHKLEYFRWNICDPACVNGKKLGVKVYAFLKDAIIRRFGEGFYRALDDAAKHIGTRE